MTAVMRFSWSARERAYIASHGQHSYAVRPTAAGWVLEVDGLVESIPNRDHKPLLRAAQDIARATGS